MYPSLRFVRRIVDERKKTGSVTPAATFVSSGADRRISESRTSATGALKSGYSEEHLLRVWHFAWLGETLVLHLDHINGVANDHRFENLRMLCPNCRSQTESFAGKSVRRKVG
jgi:hypothetical protein